MNAAPRESQAHAAASVRQSSASFPQIAEWRITSHDVQQEIVGVIDGCRSLDISEGNTADAFNLLHEATTILLGHEDVRRSGSADDYYDTCIRRVQGLLRGAAEMQSASSAIRAISSVLLERANHLAQVLDDASATPAGDALSTSGLSASEPGFMRGIAMTTKVLREIAANSATCEIEARHRGPRPQLIAPLEDALESARQDSDPAVMKGLLCGLVGSFSLGLDGFSLSAELLEAYSYEDIVGGPSTVYEASDEEGEPMPLKTENTAAEWVKQASALVDLFRPTLMADAKQPATQRDLMGMLDELAANLAKAAAATSKDECLQSLAAADGNLGDVISASEYFLSPQGWGLTYGIEHTLDKGAAWVRDNDFTVSSALVTESKVFTDPTEQRADVLLQHLDVYMEGLEHVGITAEDHSMLHQLVLPHFYKARQHLDEHATLDVIVSELQLMRAALLVLEPNMGDFNPGVPLVRASNVLIYRFIEDGSTDGGPQDPGAGPSGGGSGSPGNIDALPYTDRIEIARQAATYIARLVAHFQKPNRTGTMGDLAALGHSASVIISALTDPIEDEESLEALESASVIIPEQPPKYWKGPGLLRSRDVGKRVAEAAEAHP